MNTFYQTLWIFFLYAFLGWCSEVVFAAVKSGKFVNRGFLLGPVCPIYGFGVTFVLLLLQPLQDNLLILFVGSTVICSVLEYLVGWAAEKLLHQRLWDYSQMPFNLGGHICLAFSLMWGIACILIVRVIHPLILVLIRLIPHTLGVVLLVLFGGLFLADVILTSIDATRLPRQMKAAEELEQLIRGVSDGIGEKLYYQVNKREPRRQELEVKLVQYKALMSHTGSYRRWSKAFPHLAKQEHHRRMEAIRAYLERNKEQEP